MPTLHWLNDEEARKTSRNVPYCLLEEDTGKTYGDPNTRNMLIQGDNLIGLKALLPYYAGQVKCIFIDPPYNTGSAFEQYDDNLEHSIWLTTLFPRIELLRNFLSDDGSFWVTIDNNECHYLKIILDEIFGRNNFVESIIWRSTDNSNNDSKQFSVDHNSILVYSRNKNWRPNRVERTDDQKIHYHNPDNDPNGPWFDGNPLSSPHPRPNLTYPILSPNGITIAPPKNGWRWAKETLEEKIESGEIRFTPDGKSIRRRTYLKNQIDLPPSTLWADLEITGHNRQAKYEQKKLFGTNRDVELFSTPKPEKLMKYIFQIATNPNDIILDSFLGSGTSAAVAHKMGRRYIGLEMGDHAVTHCVPRLQKVIDGEQGGISKAVNWHGGGGFRFFRLGEPIFDENNHINPHITYHALAAHVWFSETKTPIPLDALEAKSPLLGINEGTAYYLLFNGILGDKRPEGGNVLTKRLLRLLPQFKGPKVIYGEVSLLDEPRLRAENIIFKKIPYELAVR